jgi:hypothetical protein
MRAADKVPQLIAWHQKKYRPIIYYDQMASPFPINKGERWVHRFNLVGVWLIKITLGTLKSRSKFEVGWLLAKTLTTLVVWQDRRIVEFLWNKSQYMPKIFMDIAMYYIFCFWHKNNSNMMCQQAPGELSMGLEGTWERIPALTKVEDCPQLCSLL